MGLSHYGRRRGSLHVTIAKIIVALLAAMSSEAQVAKRLFMIGNSVTDGINYGGFETLVSQSGNTLVWGRHIILGSPLAGIWSSTSGFTTSPFGPHQEALVNYAWDCVTLQPFDRPISGPDGDSLMICNFMNEAKSASPDCQFYIYSRWPRRPSDASNFTAELWNQLWLGTYTGRFERNETDRWFDSLLIQVRRANLGMKPVLIMPVGDVFHLLNQKMAAGQIPGFSSIWDVYQPLPDGIHLAGVGSYIVACTFFATLYKQDPRGLSVPSAYGAISDIVRDSIQSAVYQVVFTHPYSGTTLDDLVPASGVSVSPDALSLSVLQTASLSATVTPPNAANKRVSWYSDNTAVAIVDQMGTVTALSAGTARIIARTNSGGFTDTCVVTVSGTIPGTIQRGNLVVWDFYGIGGRNYIKATTIMAGIDTTSPSCRAWLGPGLNILSDWTNRLCGSGATAMTLTQAVAGNEYVAFRVNPLPGKLISIDTLKIAALSQNRTRTFCVFSSVNGFSETAVLDSFAATSWDSYHIRSMQGHANLPSGVEFRLTIHGYDNIYEGVGVGNNVVGADITVVGSILTPSDNVPPSAPVNLTAPFSQIRDTSVFLAWEPANDNLVVWGYNVYEGTTKLNQELVRGLNFRVRGLVSGTVHTFTVKAVDFVGNESTQEAAVTVRTNRRPTAAFSAAPLSGPAPLQVAFLPDGSADPDSGDYILGYIWEFGDGSAPDYSNAPIHVYQTPGSYTVSLRVVDSRDAYSEPVTQQIVVGAVRRMETHVSRTSYETFSPVKVYDLAGRTVMTPDAGTLRGGVDRALGGRGVRVVVEGRECRYVTRGLFGLD